MDVNINMISKEKQWTRINGRLVRLITPVFKKIDDCSVCLDDINKNDHSELPCGHIFHKKCIKKWFKYSSCHYPYQKTCPLCRKKID